MKILGIDPGSSQSGICLIDGMKIIHASNEDNHKVFGVAKKLAGGEPLIVVIEDMVPYQMQVSSAVIATCKFIGELTYRFNTCDFVSEIHLAPRTLIKKWVYDTVPEEAVPRVVKRMEAIDKRAVSKGKKGLRNSEGKLREPSFNYVDDRIVIAAMKKIFNIPTPKPGKSNIYNLHSHSWSALSVGGYQLLKA